MDANAFTWLYDGKVLRLQEVYMAFAAVSDSSNTQQNAPCDEVFKSLLR